MCIKIIPIPFNMIRLRFVEETILDGKRTDAGNICSTSEHAVEARKKQQHYFYRSMSLQVRRLWPSSSQFHLWLVTTRFKPSWPVSWKRSSQTVTSSSWLKEESCQSHPESLDKPKRDQDPELCLLFTTRSWKIWFSQLKLLVRELDTWLVVTRSKRSCWTLRTFNKSTTNWNLSKLFTTSWLVSKLFSKSQKLTKSSWCNISKQNIFYLPPLTFFLLI